MFIELKVTGMTDTVKVNTANISSVYGKVVKMNNCDILELEDDSLRELSMAIAPKDRQTKSNNADPELEALFVQLHKLTKGRGKPTFSLQREKKLKELLGKHRMTKEDLVKAATNIGNDEFLQGDNDRNKRFGDVDYLLRPDKAAKWADESNEKKKKGMF